jgi:hypothetical protein
MHTYTHKQASLEIFNYSRSSALALTARASRPSGLCAVMIENSDEERRVNG